jgi:uncharacterized protein involved in exopolysaccharide biosynthesis
MKSAAIISLVLGLPLMVSAPDARSSTCDVIAQLDARASEYRELIVQLRARYSERHPEVIALEDRLVDVEAARVAEVARAVAAGLVCFGVIEMRIASKETRPYRVGRTFQPARDRATQCVAV